MKHLFYILFLLITLVGCIKDDRQALDETTVWKETDYFFSAGGAPTWHKTESSKEEVIQFKTNNVFSSSERTNLNRYVVETVDANSAKLKLYEEGKTDTTFWTIYNITQNTMEAGFFGCVEGCGKRFVRL